MEQIRFKDKISIKRKKETKCMSFPENMLLLFLKRVVELTT